MLWHWDMVLKTHPNGMQFSCFGEEGELLATNEYFSVGGGFVVNDKTKGLYKIVVSRIRWFEFFVVDENMFYKGVDKSTVHEARLHQISSTVDTINKAHLGSDESVSSNPVVHNTEEGSGHPPYAFTSGDTLLALTKKHNVCTILYRTCQD